VTVADMKREVESLLLRAPAAETIATIKTARQFKQAVKDAQSAKSAEKLRSALIVLKGYYK
jgi:hypothetical protein